MSYSIMLDLETLSTTPNAVILTIGAVKFNPYKVNDITDGLYLRINVDEQTTLERDVSESTLTWWANQAEDVRTEALSDENRVSLDEFYKQLNKFVVGAKDIWCQGPVFDIVILENLYKQKGWPVPWQFWQIRDSRTLFGVHGDPREKNKAGLHNALEDCVSQAQAVQEIYHRLKLSEDK
jgi:hypothetical protein